MAATANDILAIARGEIETKEYPPGSNNVKYNTAYYGQEVSGPGFSWCAVFVWWVFRQAGASGLYYGGEQCAYVPTLVSWARAKKLLVDSPKPGDLVCFDFNANGVADHIGICESFDGRYVTTIDGNTGTASEANGGCVMRRKRLKKYIVNVIRPAYESEEDEDMDQSKFNEMFKTAMAAYRAGLRDNDSGSWSKQAREWAVSVDLFAGGNTLENGEPNYMWEDLLTREQAAVLFYKFAVIHGLA